MASSAGRRNILREFNSPSGPLLASAPSTSNVTFPLTPTSPEEEVIKQRGRRKLISYNIDESPVKIPYYCSPRKTPTKRIASPFKLSCTPVRSSPRKRLNLGPETLDFDEAAFEEMAISTKKGGKKQKLHNLVSNSEVPLEKGILALSHIQLVELVNNAAKSSPEIKKVLVGLMPIPDLLPLERRLYFFQRNIFKAYPRNVWGSQDDSYCYLRVRTHIDTFKKECMDQSRLLVESEQWPVVLEYVLLAWSYVKGLPNWAAAAHNKSKEFCIRHLIGHFLFAIKKAQLEQIHLLDISKRLKELDMPEELTGCVKVVEKMIENFN